MGVSKVGEEGWGRPRTGGGTLIFRRRRSLSDLAVWGFPEFSRKIFPLKPFFTLPNHFFSSSTLYFNPSSPQTPPFNSLGQAKKAFLPPKTLFSLHSLLKPLSALLRTPSESLHRVPKRPFLGLFRGFPPKPPKGLKYPFLGPF